MNTVEIWGGKILMAIVLLMISSAAVIFYRYIILQDFVIYAAQ